MRAPPPRGTRKIGRPPENLASKQFGNWKVLERDPTKEGRWVCQCGCGRIRSQRTARLKISKSCGCVAWVGRTRRQKRPLTKRPADLAGLLFGKLRVVDRGTRPENGGPKRWVCQCECGVTKEVRASSLWKGDSASCGCVAKERSKSRMHARIGTDTPEKEMLRAARGRAVKRGLSFDISEEDVRIPSTCPVLGIPLDRSTPGHAPSLDRFDTQKGYVKGNVVVISMRANRLKNDGLPHELRAVAAYASASASEFGAPSAWIS